MLPVAPIAAVIPPESRDGSWLVLVRCPYCRDRRGQRGLHLHGVLGPGGGEPLLLSRAADCAEGGEYDLGPLPANFAARVRAHKEAPPEASGMRGMVEASGGVDHEEWPESGGYE